LKNQTNKFKYKELAYREKVRKFAFWHKKNILRFTETKFNVETVKKIYFKRQNEYSLIYKFSVKSYIPEAKAQI